MTEHIFEGVLEKTAGILKNSKVWMVLHKKSLNYYKENRRSSCIGSIDLSEIQTVRPLPEKGGTRFEIITGTRSFTFVADSIEKCKEWVSQIQKAWAVESTQRDESTKETKNQDFGQIGTTAVMKKNWEKMTNTADPHTLIGNSDQAVQRRPSKKEKSDSQKLENDSQNGKETHHLSGPYDRPWTSILSVLKDDNPSSSFDEASAYSEPSGNQQRNVPNNISCDNAGQSNDKVEQENLTHTIKNDGKCSQKIISEPTVPNSINEHSKINSLSIGSEEPPIDQKDKIEPGEDFVEMRRSRTIVKVHRDGSVSNVEDVYRYGQESGMKLKSEDHSKLERQKAFDSYAVSQPEESKDSIETGESHKDLTTQYTTLSSKPDAVAVEAKKQRSSVDLIPERIETKATTLLTPKSNTSASLKANSEKPNAHQLELLEGNEEPCRDKKRFEPYALTKLKIFLENNCDLVFKRYCTPEVGMKALKEFLDGI